MRMRGETLRFWLPVVLLAAFTGYVCYRLVMSHVHPRAVEHVAHYDFEHKLLARRGSIYSSRGKDFPFVKSIVAWEYRLDPVAATNRVALGLVKEKGSKARPRTLEAVMRTISNQLDLDYEEVKEMVTKKTLNRYQNLGSSSDPDVHSRLTDKALVAGVRDEPGQERKYLYGRSLVHVLGAVNRKGAGQDGLERRLDSYLAGTPGIIKGLKDARGEEVCDKRTVSVEPKPGADVYLTVDPELQSDTETALAWGIKEFDAAAGWALVMDTRTGAIRSMASFPDYDPKHYPRNPAKDPQMRTMNRAIGYSYEPGSVMKVLTVAAAIELHPERYGPDTVFNTDRYDKEYYNLPGDSHQWEPTMTLKDAIVHSSNIVIGKLAYDLNARLGKTELYGAFRKFGLGERTGVDMDEESKGILPDPKKKRWDLGSCSRVGIGQFLTVTAMQLVSAYQSIANDGVRMRPYIVDRIVDQDGEELYRHELEEIGRTVSERTARTVREMMKGVATREGTGRLAAIRGYTIAGKTGTEQKPRKHARGYDPGKYMATVCGMIPADNPEVVILVTLDFDKSVRFHQGGNSAGPVFRRIALSTVNLLHIPADNPDELDEAEEEYQQILDERAEKNDIIYD